MSAISERAQVLSRRLTDTDTARRKAEMDRDLDLRNMLANANVDLVREAGAAELRSLTLSWMLQRTRAAELLEQTRAALQVALAYADGELPDVGEDVRRAELDGCREALRLATEAGQR